MLMRYALVSAMSAALLLLSGSRLVAADDERLKNAALVLTEMSSSFDDGIPEGLLRRASCVVVIPSVRKFALGLGGQYGRGYISCRRGESGAWSAPGGIRIEGGSFGLQIGGSATDVILLVMNERGAEKLISNQFSVGGDAAVAAGPVGRSASAQTDATMRAEILSYSRSRGVFAGISLVGSTLRQDAGENEDLYGRAIENEAIVSGEVSAPEAAAGFMAALGAFGR